MITLFYTSSPRAAVRVIRPRRSGRVIVQQRLNGQAWQPVNQYQHSAAAIDAAIEIHYTEINNYWTNQAEQYAAATATAAA